MQFKSSIEDRIPEYLKIYAQNEIKKMDDREELLHHIILINDYYKSICRQKKRLDIIKNDINIGSKTFIELKEYEKAIWLILKVLEDVVYNKEDKRVIQFKPIHKINEIFEDSGLLEIKLLRVIREMDKYICKIEISNYWIKSYYYEIYYRSINEDIIGVNIKRDRTIVFKDYE